MTNSFRIPVFVAACGVTLLWFFHPFTRYYGEPETPLLHIAIFWLVFVILSAFFLYGLLKEYKRCRHISPLIVGVCGVALFSFSYYVYEEGVFSFLGGTLTMIASLLDIILRKVVYKKTIVCILVGLLGALFFGPLDIRSFTPTEVALVGTLMLLPGGMFLLFPLKFIATFWIGLLISSFLFLYGFFQRYRLHKNVLGILPLIFATFGILLIFVDEYFFSSMGIRMEDNIIPIGGMTSLLSIVFMLSAMMLESVVSLFDKHAQM